MNTRKITYCLLLLFISLAGPRPIFHSHDCLLDLGNSPRQLAQHLSTHHRSDTAPLPANQFHCHWTCGEYSCFSNCSGDSFGDSQFAAASPWTMDNLFQQLHATFHATLLGYLTLDDIESEQLSYEPLIFGSFESSRDRLQHLCVWNC